MKRIIALLLLITMLWGCGATNSLGFHGVVKFSDMEYERPVIEDLQTLTEESCEIARTSTDIDHVEETIWKLYAAIDHYATAYDLAYIHYHADLSDTYWQEEYAYCAEHAPEADAAVEELYAALAQSPILEELEGDNYFGPGFFDSYQDGESGYDDILMSFLNQEQNLIAEYYDLSEQAQSVVYYSTAYFDEYAEPMAQVLVDLIAVRQKIATYCGYNSYPAFAYDSYYYRDYTWRQAETYLDSIEQELAPLFRRLNRTDIWEPSKASCSEAEVFGHVQEAAKAMGGSTWEAFQLLEQGQLYDIGMGENKSGLSFELFLEDYYQPYVFVTGTETAYDKFSFAHEFGHFVMDYAAAGTYAGTDVMEIFSQGMEYLSLSYANADDALVEVKLMDSLATYVEQAAYAEFEHRMYELQGDSLNTKNLFALYEEICTAYGFEKTRWNPKDLVTTPHFYEQPLYIISYVVSNDAAMQLYERELETAGAGRNLFDANLTTEESFFLAFLETAGLKSPFAPERITEVRDFFEEQFAK